MTKKMRSRMQMQAMFLARSQRLTRSSIAAAAQAAASRAGDADDDADGYDNGGYDDYGDGDGHDHDFGSDDDMAGFGGDQGGEEGADQLGEAGVGGVGAGVGGFAVGLGANGVNMDDELDAAIRTDEGASIVSCTYESFCKAHVAEFMRGAQAFAQVRMGRDGERGTGVSVCGGGDEE